MRQHRYGIRYFDHSFFVAILNLVKLTNLINLISLVTLLSIFGLFSMSASAQTAQNTTPGSTVIEASAITYYAVEGDTLSSIALKFTNKISNWNSLGKINRIQNDRTIPIGTTIKIPHDLLPDVPSTATVIAIAGVVTETRDGSTKAISLGSVVEEGSQITTSKNGFITFALPDASRISIPSNSQVVMTKLRMRQFTKSPSTEISLTQGRIESKITPLANNKGRFEVTSPLSIAGVRGTHFRVSLVDNGTANEVLTGAVEVTKTEVLKASKKSKIANKLYASIAPKALTLTAGKGNVISQTAVGEAVNLLSAPHLETGFELQERLTLQFNVVPQADAANYRAQISLDAESQHIIAENTAKDARIKLTDIDDGSYFIKVTAIDHQGLEGIPSIQAFIVKAHPEPPFMRAPKKKVRGETLAFKWTEVVNAKFYRLQVASDAQFKDIKLDQSNIIGPQFFTNQLPLGQYFWRIASIAETNQKPDQGPFSIPESIQLLAAQKMNPVGNSDGESIEFSWPAEPLQQFLVQISEDADFKKLYLTKEKKEANLSISRPAPGTYYIRVRATDDDGFIGGFSSPQKFDIFQQWKTGSGDVLNSSAGAVRPQQ